MNKVDEGINRFNKALNAYINIESDSDLTKNKITYAEYKAMGILLDALRFDGEAETMNEGVKNFFERHGMATERKGIGWKITR